MPKVISQVIGGSGGAGFKPDGSVPMEGNADFAGYSIMGLSRREVDVPNGSTYTATTDDIGCTFVVGVGTGTTTIKLPTDAGSVEAEYYLRNGPSASGPLVITSVSGTAELYGMNGHILPGAPAVYAITYVSQDTHRVVVPASGNVILVESDMPTILVDGDVMSHSRKFLYTSSIEFTTAPKLPASPALGDWVTVADLSGNSGTVNKIIDGNGHNISDGNAASSSTAAFTSNYFRCVTFTYNGTIWCASEG